jgi:DNA-binding NarL/FixJ family response regulator
VPVIVVTGETSEETRRQCERLGVHEYLPKPAGYDTLLEAIRRSLARPEEEDYKVVTLRLPTRVIRRLSDINTNLERAVTILCNCEEPDEEEQTRAARP